MRAAGSDCHRRAMARTGVTIVLDLDPTADSPVGTARLPDGTHRAFHGWLGLAEAIDALAGIRAERADSSPSPESSRDGAGAERTERSPSS